MTGECKQTLIGHSSWISCVSITRDCKTIISGSNDKNVKLWNATGNENAMNLSTPSDHIIHHATQPECVTIAKGGRWGLSGSKNDSLKLWDISSATCVKSFSASIACMSALHQSAQVVTGSHSGDITLWNCSSSLELQQTLHVHQGGIVALQVSRDDSIIISASSDKTVGFCHGDLGYSEQLIGHSDAVLCVSLMNTKLSAISGSKDKTVRMWNLSTKTWERTFTGHTAAVGCLASTSDDSIVVSGSGDFTIRVWMTKSGECLRTLEGHHDSIKCLQITGDNQNNDRFLIAGSHEGKDQLLLWDLTSGTCARKFKGHTHAVMNLKILHRDKHLLGPRNCDSRVLVTSSRDGTIKAWNMENGELINSFDFQSQVKYFDAYPSDDGFSVVLVTKSGTVSVLKFHYPKQDTKAAESILFTNDHSQGVSPTLHDDNLSVPDKTSTSCCANCVCCICCQKCTVM